MIWILGSTLVLAVGGLIWLSLRRAAGGDDPGAAPDTAIYRDQLAEIERDRARNVLPEAEAERARAEVARRLLAAEDRARTPSRRGPAPAALVLFALLGGGALALYGWLGAPGYPDMGLSERIALAEDLRANRPDQATREAALPVWAPPPGTDESYLKLVEELRTAVARRPDDLQGQQLLVRHEAALGNMRSARLAAERVVGIKGDAATAGDWLTLAGVSIEAAGGFVTPEAEHALRQVLDRDPANGPGQYYLGLMLWQTGRPDLTFRIWDRLLRQGPQDAPWVAMIRPDMMRVAGLAGVRYEMPAAATPPAFDLPPGPSQDDVAAAEDMSAEDRQQMIRGMVEGLAERLASDGGTPAEWARLIRALGVLGETDRARAIYAEARETFGTIPEALAEVETAAEAAGIAE